MTDTLVGAIGHSVGVAPPAFQEHHIGLLDAGAVYSRHRFVGGGLSSVDLSRVVGTTHPDYSNCSWGSLVGRPFGAGLPLLKRLADVLLALERNPGYYLSSERKEHWSFIEVDGRLYWDAGAHRTCIARYYLDYLGVPQIVHGVHLEVFESRIA